MAVRGTRFRSASTRAHSSPDGPAQGPTTPGGLMAGETVITVIGNLTSDPELRFTPSGAAVAGFTVASTPRRFNRDTGQWEDQEALFLRCSVWRQAAENVAE